jgi:hypothetical protein
MDGQTGFGPGSEDEGFDGLLPEDDAVTLAELVAKDVLTAGDVLEPGHTMGVGGAEGIRIVARTAQEVEEIASVCGLLMAGVDEKAMTSLGTLSGR